MMIGPGSWRFSAKTSVSRPRSLLQWRTRAYTRRRSHSQPRAARSSSPVDTSFMLFDRGSEVPQATIRRAPADWGDLLAGDFLRWSLTRWQWLRPRMVPVVVAFIGMLGMLQAVDYLSQPHDAQVATQTEVMLAR